MTAPKTSHEIDMYAAETSRIQALTELLKLISMTSSPAAPVVVTRDAALSQITSILSGPNVSGLTITRILSPAADAKKP